MFGANLYKVMNNQGFCWHCHHEVLLEYCHDFPGRVDYIRRCKPTHEQKLRLRLFKPVKGELPEEVVKARQAYAGARQAYDEARQAYDEARQACTEAIRAYEKAIAKNMPAIKELHTRECPNCPWDGKTIFPE